MFRLSDISVVSNPVEYNLVKQKYNVKNLKINPSFVDTKIFYRKSSNNQLINKRVLFVGRFENVKNIINTIDGVLGAGLSIDLYGDGSLKKEIKNRYKKYISNNRVNINEIIPNNELAKQYRKYNFYILMSYYEGMSKTLIEAMSSGLVCIVSKIPQNESLVTDKVTGIVVDGFKSKYIEEVLKNLSNYSCSDISKNASKYIQSNFTLDIVCEREMSFINGILE